MRENGGQYTHAAIWLAIACFKAGRADDGYGILKDIIDVGYTENYEGESFVIAADVSDKGRCGWSWYTGAAAWYYRIMLEYVLGLKLGKNKILSSNPIIEYEAVLEFETAKLKIWRSGEYKDISIVFDEYDEEEVRRIEEKQKEELQKQLPQNNQEYQQYPNNYDRDELEDFFWDFFMDEFGY